MDVVALAQHGVENAVATLGTATTPVHVTKLMKLADTVVFCFDGDEAGRKAAWRALEVSLPVLADGKTVSFLFLPAEDDPDTYVRRLGKEAFLEAVKAAKPLSQFLFTELTSRVDMKSDEGRARFLALAKPLVTEVQAPALGAMLRKHAAELSGLDVREIGAMLGARPPERRAAPPPPARAAKRVQPLEAKLLARLLHEPRMVEAIPPGALYGVGPEANALRALVEYLRRYPGAKPGQASAYFRDSEHEEIVSQALSEPLLAEAEEGGEVDFATEIRDFAGQLEREHEARRSSELVRLMAVATTTPEQKAEYMAEYAALQARRAPAENGNSPPESRSKL
jgi:DNA primase